MEPPPLPPPPRRPPALPEEMVEEILIRFPPEDPASLVRAILVCKPWCRLVSGAGFRRRFRQFHRTPPVLGFVCHLRGGGGPVARFVPTSSFRPPHTDHRDWRVLDARHGRVLLRNANWGPDRFVVWDPVTDERREIPINWGSAVRTKTWLASVLCASTEDCDHLDCHRGHFLVVLLSGHDNLQLCIYSSKTGAWSQRTCLDHQRTIDKSAVVLVENALYFRIDSESILKYDLASQETSMILQPPGSDKLITMEDGRLGVAKLEEAARLSLWSMEENTNGDIGWTQIRVIDLKKLLYHANVRSFFSKCIRFELGIGVLLVGTTYDGLFCFDLKSGRVIRKLCVETWHVRSIRLIVPYISFFTPAVFSTDEGPSVGA